MLIRVKTLSGKVFALTDLAEDTTLLGIKKKVAEKANVDPSLQRVFHKGRILSDEDDDQKLLDQGVKDSDFVVVTVRRQPDPKPTLEPAPLKETIVEHTRVDEPAAESPRGFLPQIQELVGQLAGLRAEGAQADDIPTVDQGALTFLKDMGFSEARATKALLLNRAGAQEAMEWLLEHSEDPDIDTPLTAEQLRAIADQNANPEPSPAMVESLKEMGFPEEDVLQALRATGNNFEAATSWLLGDRDVEEEDEDEGDLSLSNPLVNEIIHNPVVQQGLSNPRVLQALRQLMISPDSAEQYFDDPDVGPVVRQISNILTGGDSSDSESNSNDDPVDL